MNIKKSLPRFGLVMLVIAPQVAGAQSSVQSFILKVNEVIINPLVGFLFAVAFLWFLYGVVRYLLAREVNGAEADEGKRHMLWGLIGMFIMFAAFSIMQLIANTIGSTLG